MTTATKVQRQDCPDCRTEMHYELRRTMHFNGGRGDVVVDRFHCTNCRRFYNVPVVEEKKSHLDVAQG